MNNIIFSNSKLATWANNEAKAIKKLGYKRSKLYLQRLNELRSITAINDLNYLPGKHHSLKGDRSGQWSCNLDGGYRLIYSPEEDSKGNIIKITITVLEIIDYH